MNSRNLPEPAGHEVYAELAAGWALHALEPDDEKHFAAHLDTCPACQSAIADYSGALAELSFLSPAVEPPARLGGRIRAEVARELDVENERRAIERRYRAQPAEEPWPAVERRRHRERALPPPVPHSRRSRRSGRAAATRWLAAAAAAVALVLGVGNIIQYQRTLDAERRADQRAAALRAEEQEANRRRELIRLLTQSGTRVSQLAENGRTVGYVLIHDNQVEVLTDGMSRNDRTKEYVLWMIGSGGGNPRPIGKFDVSRSDIELRSVSELPSVSGGIAAFAVSIEPRQDGLPASPTDVVAEGKAVI